MLMKCDDLVMFGNYITDANKTGYKQHSVVLVLKLFDNLCCFGDVNFWTTLCIIESQN